MSSPDPQSPPSDAGADVALRVVGVSKRFAARPSSSSRPSSSPSAGELEILRDVTLSLDDGQRAVILGPSGSGKSTLLHILGTLERPSDGEVWIRGERPFTLDDEQLAGFRNRRVGFVFQDHHLLPQFSVLENVLLPTLAAPPETGDGTGDAPRERALELLERVGLSHRLDHRPAELSGGERQRVAVARALIRRPTLLLCDEPTGSLDQATAETVTELLLEVHAEEPSILIVVTHSLDLADRFEHRFTLRDGRLV